MPGPEALRGAKPVGRWVGAWACGFGVFVVAAWIVGAQAAPDGFQVAGAEGQWARVAAVLLGAAALGVVMPLVAGHDLPGGPASAVGMGLVAIAQIGRSAMTGEPIKPVGYWPHAVLETLLVAAALVTAHAVNAAMIQKVVGLERREAWRRQARVGSRRERKPAGGIFLAMGAAAIVAVAITSGINHGQRGEGVSAICMGIMALVAAMLMHRSAPIRDSLWFALSVPLWMALLPVLGWVLVQATGDPRLPLLVAMSSVGTSPFAVCGGGIVGAMVGFWISYKG